MFIYSEIFVYIYIYIYSGICSENLCSHIFRNIYIQIFIYVQSIYSYIYIWYIFRNYNSDIYNLRNIQICPALDAHKIFPPHKMYSGNVDTSYYRYTGYGSSIFTISCVLYPYGLSDVIKIFFETGKWDNLSLID